MLAPCIICLLSVCAWLIQRTRDTKDLFSFILFSLWTKGLSPPSSRSRRGCSTPRVHQDHSTWAASQEGRAGDDLSQSCPENKNAVLWGLLAVCNVASSQLGTKTQTLKIV